MDKATRLALTEYLKKRPSDGTDRLFVGQRGPLNAPGIDYIVQKYAYQARLEDCTSHTLRHTFAKNLVDAKKTLDVVAFLLGLQIIETTRIYSAPSEKDLERAVREAAGEL